MLVNSNSLRGKNEWLIIEKLSEGDAGVIYVVSSDVGNETVSAILKRPQNGPLAAERQSPQITQEGMLLEKLSDLKAGYHNKFAARSVKLLDKNLITKNKEDTFIVIERAAGFSLKELSDVAKNGLKRLGGKEIRKSELIFLERIAINKKIPDLIILRALYILLEFLEKVHKLDFVDRDERKIAGVVWNDIKPDHIFWGPEEKLFTIIDWGNSQLLESNGISKDGNYSKENDFLQYIISMGSFLKQASQKIYDRLDWPASTQDANNISGVISDIKTKLYRELLLVEDRVEPLIQRQTLLDSNSSHYMTEMIDLHNAILDHGEWPDYKHAEKLSLKLVNDIISDSKSSLEEALDVCQVVANFPLQSTQNWEILLQLIQLSRGKSGDAFMRQAVRAAISKEENWEEVLWSMQMAVGSGDVSDEWLGLIKLLRQMIGISPDVRTPFSVLQEINHNLGMGTSQINKNWLSPSIQRFFDLWKEWRGIPKGNKLLNSPFIYQDMKVLLNQLSANDEKLSSLNHEFSISIKLAETVADGFWDEWCNKDFDRAGKFLKRLLVYDPDCLRVFVFEDCVNKVPNWLKEIQKGSGKKNDLIKEGQRYVNLLGVNNSVSTDRSNRADWLHEIFAKLSETGLNKLLSILIPSGKTRLKDLDEYYGHIKNVHWNKALEVLERKSLKLYSEFYSNLIKIIQDVVKGLKVENIPASPGLQDDPNYIVLYDVLLDIEEWYHNLGEKGIRASGNIYANTLKQKETEWLFLQSITEKQNELDEYINFFQRLKEKKWSEALNALQSITGKEVKDIKVQIRNLLESLSQGKETFDSQSLPEFDDQRFSTILTEIGDKSQMVLKELDKKKESAKDYSVWVVADWGEITSNLNSIGNASSESLKNYNLYSAATIEYDQKPRAREFLDSLHKLEFELSGQTTQSDFWIGVFNRIIDENISPKESGLTSSHPLYTFLKKFEIYPISIPGPIPTPIPGPIPTPVLLRWVIVIFIGLVGIGSVSGLGMFISKKFQLTSMTNTVEIATTVVPTEETIVLTEPEVPTTLTVLPESQIPPQNTQLVNVTETLSPTVTQLTECETVQLFVQNNSWVEYKKFLNDRNADYETLKEKCGWTQKYYIRKIDVSLRSALKLSIQGEKDVARGEIVDLFEKELKADPELVNMVPPGEDIEPFIKDLRIYISLCDSVPNGYLNELDKTRFLMFLEKNIGVFKWNGNLFNFICGKTPTFFHDKEIGQAPNTPISLLKKHLYPFKDSSGGPQNCIYFDGKQNYHYYPFETFQCNLAPMQLEEKPIPLKQFSFINTRICVISPGLKESNFYYGLFVKQKGVSPLSEFLFINQDQKLDVSLGDIAISLDSEQMRKQFSCDTKGGVHIIIRIVGNLLLWGFGTEDWESEQYYLGSVLDDEFINLPVDIGFTGNATINNNKDDEQRKQLHIVILNLDLSLPGER